MGDLPTAGVKICGLSTPETIHAAVQAGVTFIGFVFFPKSPRNVSAELARDLGAEIPPQVLKTGLFVKQSVEEIANIVKTAKLDAVQLHGTYKAEEILAVKALTGKPVLWAKGISCEADFGGIDAEVAATDYLLFDAKAPAGSDRPGGNALSFDWKLLANRTFPKPWMLAGGLNPDNVAEAMGKTGAKLVDVSSGVETAAGVKSTQLIKDFVLAAR